MSEITKLYENAGIEPDINYVCDKEPCEQHSVDCQECSHLYDTREDYPDFTAEKQIELIKWFVTNNAELETLEITYYLNDCFQISSCAKSSHFETNFEDALAGLINNLWQDLTEQEKQQVKGILE